MIGSHIVEISLVEPVSWWFRLSGGGSIRADTLWRIIANGEVRAISEDHGHMFGLPEPVDSAIRAHEVLSQSLITAASVRNHAGDVVLEFDNTAVLEVLTTSCGYESWAVFFPNRDEAIGLGGGEVELRRHDG